MKHKHSYMQQVGALVYGMNRMNTYMGRAGKADRDCMDVLREMRG